MSRYAALIRASSNRVYAESSVALTRAELAVFGRTALAGRVSDIGDDTLGGVRYVAFDAEALSADDIAALSNLSSLHALFECVGELLRPITLAPLDRFDDDLLTIQKYSGKTNEQFTKLLLNVTLLSTAFPDSLTARRFSVLDPLCGRGTTLNQSMMYGFDAAGIELDQKDFEAYSSFLSTWLKRKRLKHRFDSGPLRRDKRVIARRLTAEFAVSKDDFKAGETRRVEVVNADTARAGEFFASESFDVIVADAPYGVQHGSRAPSSGQATRPALTRSPLRLLETALPAWVRLLRRGGAVGISWNANVAARDDVAALLRDAGLEPLDDEPYLGFRHRVDQAIVRDLIVARKGS